MGFATDETPCTGEASEIPLGQRSSEPAHRARGLDLSHRTGWVVAVTETRGTRPVHRSVRESLRRMRIQPFPAVQAPRRGAMYPCGIGDPLSGGECYETVEGIGTWAWFSSGLHSDLVNELPTEAL